jgi:starch synthase
MDDFVRVGGLVAVSAALPRALRRWSDVRILLPGYRDVVEQFTHIQIVGQCAALAEMPACSLGLASTKDGLPVYILLCPQLYDRPGNPYGDTAGRDWPDNDVRFGRFASAAAQLAAGTLDKNWAADLVHANDWQAALVPAYLAWNEVRIPTILTIHNLAYQGLFPKESLRRIGAPEHSFHIEGLEFYDKLSFLKGGIVYASHLTTVSETYAREITTTELGCGLEGLLRRRSDAEQLTGILNGIDESWDPRVCAQLAQPFGAGDWEGKRANADYVRQQFGLALSRGPIFGLVARLVHQKGVDLVLSAADEIIEAGGQIVAIGSGEPEIEQALIDAHRRRPDAIGVAIGFNDGAADFCRQRFYVDAVAFRAVRPEPDVRAEVRIAADRPPDRRARRNHHGRRNRIPVHPTVDRVVPRRYPARVHNLRGEGSPRLHAPQCDVAIV